MAAVSYSKGTAAYVFEIDTRCQIAKNLKNTNQVSPSILHGHVVDLERFWTFSGVLFYIFYIHVGCFTAAV